MEIPSFLNAKKEDRRSRDDPHHEYVIENGCRREGLDRRRDTLARSVVDMLDRIGLHRPAEFARALAAKKLLGPALMSASALLSLAAYAAIVGWKEGAIIVLALVFHELGHFISAYRRTGRIHWFWFIPYLGAMMGLPEIESRDDEAWIGIGGPLSGTIVSALALLMWKFVSFPPEVSLLVWRFALVSTLLNLFNMTPISPLDGGRITQASHIGFQWFGFAALIAVSWYTREPAVLLVWMLVALDRFFAYPAWRFASALILLCGMATLMFSGGDKSSLIENVFYVAFGAALVILSRPGDLEPVDDPHPELSKGKRVAWALAWASLTGVLLLLLAYDLRII